MTENNLLAQWFTKIQSIDELQLARVQCGICHGIKSYNKYEYCDTDIVKHLIEKNWTIINDIVYCPECRKQYESLQNIAQQNIRPSKISYYLNIAKEVSTRATCLRKK